MNLPGFVRRYVDDTAFRSAIRKKEAEYRAYLETGKSMGEALSKAEVPESGRAMAVVAYEHPEFIELQYRTIRRYYEDNYLVFDNSPSEEKQREIRALCEKHGIPYFRLPPSPFDGWAGSESHGASINLITEVLRDAGFGQVLYLDHDAFPFAPSDIFAELKTQPFFGKRQDRQIGRKWMWYIWPGYLALDLSRMRTVDFRTIRGADTGSAMWPLYYRKENADSLRFAVEDHVYIDRLREWTEGNKHRIENIDGIDTALFVEVLDDSWIHMVGGTVPKNRKSKFDVIRELLQA